MTAPTEARPIPPYAPWSTWTSFIDALKQTAIPSHIDASVTPRMSGTAISQVRGVNRFLGAVDESGAVTHVLRDLVAAWGTPEWKDKLIEVVFNAYDPILGENFDLDTATLKQLVDRFRENGSVSGTVLRKAIRFYLDAVAATGVKVSPHFKARGLSILSGDRVPGRPNGKALTPRTPAASTPAVRTETAKGAAHTPGADELVVQVPGRTPLLLPLPADLAEEEWQFISNFVVAYMKLRKGKK